jgi:hypothetical protein
MNDSDSAKINVLSQGTADNCTSWEKGGGKKNSSLQDCKQGNMQLVGRLSESKHAYDQCHYNAALKV